MPLADTLKNTGLDAMAAEASHAGLRDTGTETTGGSYARQALTWGAASGGSVAITNTPEFDVPGGETVNEVALFDALTTGNYLGHGDVTSETFGGDGTYTVNSLTITLTDPA